MELNYSQWLRHHSSLFRKYTVSLDLLSFNVAKNLSKQENHNNAPSIILYTNKTVRKISDNLTFRHFIWHIISATFVGLSINKQVSRKISINTRRQFQLRVISKLQSKTVYCKITNVHITRINWYVHSLDLAINLTIFFHYRSLSFQQEMLI
jgi:hypothetical protein